MKSKVFKIFVLNLIFTTVLFSQKKVKLIHADSLVGIKYDSKTVRKLIGNVHLAQGKVNLWCDKAIQYIGEDRIEVYGNVKIQQDTLVFTAYEGIYLGKTKIAMGRGNVKLTDGNVTLTAESGSYDLNKKVANFKTNVKLVDSTMVLNADELFYYRKEKKLVAIGNVSIFDPKRNTTIYGTYFENYDSSKYSVIKGEPKLVRIDTASDGSLDTLVVSGKFMESYRDTSVSMFSASDSVVIVQGDLSAKCGEVIYYDKKGIIIMWRNPVIWYGKSQVSGDSVVVSLRRGALDEVRVYHRAFALSESDSSYPERINQLKGKFIKIKFFRRKINELWVVGNAESMYFLFDEVEPDSLVPKGVNRVSGDSIWVKFENGRISRIKVMGGVEGVYYPEVMVKGRESSYRLEGFNFMDKDKLINRRKLLNILAKLTRRSHG